MTNAGADGRSRHEAESFATRPFEATLAWVFSGTSEMGGNLFKLGRLPRTEYRIVEDDVRSLLDDLIGDRYRIPRYYASKPDFGDLDVVLSKDAIALLGGPEGFVEALRKGLGVSQTKSVGHVFATVFRDFQVDYFIREPELVEATYHYLSFNDLGNLIGKIYRRFGLKYGEDGLCYVFRRASQPSYKREHLVSRDWPRILGFLGLDVPAWTAGFESLEEMFAWVVASPYFSVEPYESPARTTDRRARKRPTMAKFMAYLEAEGIERRYAYLPEREGYVASIAAAFPEAGLESALAEELAREMETLALRDKFNGELVRQWTRLEGKTLGAFLRRFSAVYPSESLAALQPRAIQALVEAFPVDD